MAASASDSESDQERLKLQKANEVAWLQVASLAEEVNDLQKAADAYEHVLRHNDRNVHALLQLASISRLQERFADAVGYLNKVLQTDGSSGEVHGAIGHCYLTLSQRAEGVPAVLDCLRLCYDAYHEASLHLGAFNDPNLWYGIGLLYERYGALIPAGSTQRECYQAAEEALRSVLQAAPHFEKRAEILYRLGMIYKHQEQPQQALECLQAICDQPPPPLSQADVWFLIGSVQETMEPPAPEFAKQAYEHVLRLMQMNNDPKVGRVYRQLGWVCHKFGLDLPATLVAQMGMQQVVASPLGCLMHALEIDFADAQNWYLLGKCLLDHMEVDGAYDCLAHAVQIDPANADAWSTVGTIYMARGQTTDAVAAFEHCVHLSPGSSAWFDLGSARHHLLTSTETIADATAITFAVEAYTKALSICSSKRDDICSRLQHLQSMQAAVGSGVAGASSSCSAAAAATSVSVPVTDPGLASGFLPVGIGGDSAPSSEMAATLASTTGPGLAVALARAPAPNEGVSAAMTGDMPAVGDAVVNAESGLLAVAPAASGGNGACASVDVSDVAVGECGAAYASSAVMPPAQGFGAPALEADAA